MAKDFDPYYTWLGIPPQEQPADHYRLIGIRRFEKEMDVIGNAMDRQMQFLRSMQVGKRAAHSQKLLNEISAAGGCLLDPQRKAKYDKELLAIESGKAQAAKNLAAKSRPIVKAIPLTVAAPQVAPSPEPNMFALPLSQPTYVAPIKVVLRPAGKSFPKLPLILAGAIGGALIMIAIGGWILSGGRTVDVKPTPKKTPVPVVPVMAKKVTPVPAIQVKSKDKPKAKSPVEPETAFFGRFYVHVDDSAVIMIRGKTIRCETGESISMPLLLAVGDLVVVELDDIGNLRRLGMAFVSEDRQQVISFGAEDFRVVNASKASDITAEMVRSSNIGAQKITDEYVESGNGQLPVPAGVRYDSQFFWGNESHCFIATTIRNPMIKTKESK